ncbi:hypothetical protein E2C01_031150 [Portunus trituberculatus]|uniref:Uncharacterized protein n=1 Tax=Portunus trituberculatus TaxID=210409 RepID=A0A5B7EXU2_PORTR|nr:hypothetical protein [Portunus trituberculatus]
MRRVKEREGKRGLTRVLPGAVRVGGRGRGMQTLGPLTREAYNAHLKPRVLLLDARRGEVARADGCENHRVVNRGGCEEPRLAAGGTAPGTCLQVRCSGLLKAKASLPVSDLRLNGDGWHRCVCKVGQTLETFMSVGVVLHMLPLESTHPCPAKPASQHHYITGTQDTARHAPQESRLPARSPRRVTRSTRRSLFYTACLVSGRRDPSPGLHTGHYHGIVTRGGRLVSRRYRATEIPLG